ncbi:MAG: alpha/beta fold hydrolase [Flavobacteriales bacterium]|nr:alpha/beta fold hydrolase [Flavobacteriales bacterium]
MAATNQAHPGKLPSQAERRTYQHGDIAVEYGIWRPPGAVTQAAVALHGFSRPLEDMLAVRDLVPPNTAVLMPHLAAHGSSSGHHRPLMPADWYATLDRILEAEQLAFEGTLIGYSLGGRLALNWWAENPTRFSKVILMAPDGLVKNPGYRLSVDTPIGRAWLSQSERQRPSLVRVLSGLRRGGLLPEHFYQFSMFHLEGPTMWAMVVDCWLSLRLFWPPGRARLQHLAADHPGVLEAHFGARDKIIKPRNARKLEGVCTVEFHPCGHGLLRPDIIQRIASPSSKS